MRRREPTSLKIVRGNPGHQRINRAEPKPVSILPSPPSALSTAAKKIWKSHGAQLEELGVVTKIDEASFAAYCATYARWMELQGYLRTAPLVVERSNGGLEANPVIKMAADQQVLLLKVAMEFGLTPAARSKVSATASTQDALEIFLNGGRNTNAG